MSTTPVETFPPKETSAEPLRAAKRPVASGALTILGMIWAALLVALAVVCLHDVLVTLGALGGEPWINLILTGLDGLIPGIWVFPAGLLCVIVGLLLLAAAIKPRPRRGIEVQADTGVLVSKSAVRKLASAAARNVDGVDTTSTTASQRRVTVDATILSSTREDEVKQAVSDAVNDRLSALRKAPSVRVRTKSKGANR